MKKNPRVFDSWPRDVDVYPDENQGSGTAEGAVSRLKPEEVVKKLERRRAGVRPQVRAIIGQSAGCLYGGWIFFTASDLRNKPRLLGISKIYEQGDSCEDDSIDDERRERVGLQVAQKITNAQKARDRRGCGSYCHKQPLDFWTR